MTTLSPEWTVEQWAAGCTACGSPIKCPQWIASGTLACELYPCYCDQTRASAPEFVEDPQCWWRKKGTGQLASRCPCWGRKRDDWLPEDCCSRHDANPQYLLLPEFMARPVATVPDGPGDPREAPERERSAGASGVRATGQPTAYTRLWPPEETTCPCKTPWDGQKTGGGHHCPSCHTNWVNANVALIHQPTVLHPCRDPHSIMDIDSRRPLLYARDVRGARVWAFAW
jgi:hypothetical protein